MNQNLKTSRGLLEKKMPDTPKTHEECRLSVCFFCLCKADRQLSDGNKKFISDNLFSKFEKYHDILPNGTCGTCRKKLSLKQDMKKIDYDELLSLLLSIRPATRNSPNCPCKICEVGRSGLRYTQKKAMPEKKKAGRPRSSSPSPARKKLCSECFTEVGPGLAHNCGSRREKLKNLQVSLSPNTQSQLASKFIKNKEAVANVNFRSEIELKTHGKPLKVATGTKPKESSAAVTLETFEKVQLNLNLSNKKLNQMGSVLRSSLGKKSVEPGLRAHIRSMGESLEKYFKVEFLQFERKNKDTNEINEEFVPAVVCSDLEEFINHIKQRRDIDYEVINKIGIDGGNFFFFKSSHLKFSCLEN